jgi:hypothetical protein
VDGHLLTGSATVAPERMGYSMDAFFVARAIYDFKPLPN